MKKIGLFFMLFLIAFAFTACKKDDTIDAKLEIEDITLTKGAETEIDYKITPEGTFGVLSFEIISGEGIISITGMAVRALEVGTAQVKAVAENMKGAKKTFKTETTFTVTVEPIASVEGEHILNGGFEFGLLEWNAVSDPEDYSYGTTVVDNSPHSGEAALNLWFDADGDEVGEALDLTLSQEITGLEDGTYLFSLWFKGAITSVAMAVKSGDQVLSEGEFSGYDYKPVPENSGYVHCGIEVEISGKTSVTVEIKLLGDAECWGYVDDVSFKKGSLEDLEKAPETPEEGYLNFIKGGAFNNLNDWEIERSGEAQNKEVNLSEGKLSIWANGIAEFRISQKVWLPEAAYNLVIYFNGGEFGSNDFDAEESYAYVKQGDTVHELDIVPTGYGEGEMTRVELEDLELGGEVEVGLYFNFTGGGNNWINLDDFMLYSKDLEIDAADLEAAEAVRGMISALDLENLTLADAEAVTAAREAYDALTELQKLLVTNEDRLLAAEALIEELKKPSPEGYQNFIKGGNFDSDEHFESSITGEAADKGINFNGTLAIWAKGSAEASVKQVLTGLPAETYQLLVELNGGEPGNEFNTTEAYVYVKQGEMVKQADLVPEGWNDGAYRKLYILDIEISEGADVEVGIKIVFEGGHNNWINLDNLTFWSANIPEPEPTEEDHQAAAAVDALIAALDLETLTLEDEETVIAAREAYDALTELQKTLVTKLEDLVALEAKIQDLKGVVDYPLVTLEEFNAQGGFETDDWSLATLEWKFEGGHGWVSEGWTVDGSMRYDVFKEQTSANARIYKGVKELPAGTYELSLHLAGGDLSQVKVLFGSEEFLITDYSGDYQKYSFYLEYDGSGHLYVEIAITREENGWASLDAIGIAGYDYPIESLEDFNRHGGFEPVGGDWSLAGMKWKVEGGCGWTDGNWQHEGEVSYDVFRDTDATNASISKGVLLDAGNYALKLYAAGGNLSRITVEIGGEASEITCGGSFEERTISFQVDDKGPVLVKISAERAAEGWLRLDNISISVNEE